MKERPYQSDAHDAILRAFDGGEQAALAVLATGLGKTVIAAHVAKTMLGRRGGRVMVLAHRDELIRQAASKFSTITGVLPVIEKADERSDEAGMHGKPPVVISSFQTQYRGADGRERMRRFDPHEFSFLWVDEGHHALAPSYRKVIDHYRSNPKLKVLYVTATPDRADGESMGQIVKLPPAYNYDLRQAVKDGWLVSVRQRSVQIEGLDFSKCRTLAGDFNAADLEAAMLVEKPLHGVAHATIEWACGLPERSLRAIKDDPDRAAKLAAMVAGRRVRPTLIFAVGVKQAERLAEIINRWMPGTAAHVEGDTPIDDRKKMYRAFAEGRISFLVGCMVPTEGFDAPHVEIVVMARPTQSRPLYAQMTGRGTRPAESISHKLGEVDGAEQRKAMIAASEKTHCLVLDFVGNCGRHRLVTAADILSADPNDDGLIERARRISEEREIDVAEALEQATEESEREQAALLKECADAEAEADRIEDEQVRALQAARRAELVAVADYQTTEVTESSLRVDRASPMKRGGASDAQIEALVKMGVRRETAMGYSGRQASAVISDLRKKRPASDGQRRYLHRLGLSDAEIDVLSFDAASARIDELKGAAA